MAESKEAVRERVRKFRALKRLNAVTVTDVTDVKAPRMGIIEIRPRQMGEECQGCDALRSLEERLQKLESPEPKKQLRPIKSEPVPQDWRKDKVVGCRKFGE